MTTSTVDLFRIGIGPSSSHTVGPMRAARQFVERLSECGMLEQIHSVQTELFGSLALTGRGHGTDRAVLLGLSGERPEELDPEEMISKVATVRSSRILRLLNVHAIGFNESTHLLFCKDMALPGHPNALRFSACDACGNLIRREAYYSVGGGFVVKEGDPACSGESGRSVPYPFSSAAELLRTAEGAGLRIWELMFENERALHGEDAVRAYIRTVWSAMRACMERGLREEGILPGGLNVRRRAPGLINKLTEHVSGDALAGMDWVNAFAIAVAEENAAGGRVVTAPTNGAAGVIPAVLRYYEQFVPSASEDGVLRFFLTAGAVGILFMENASISGAEVGCQGEIGVACSMAAAGLVAALNGTNEQIETAAEIGMEHHLGMTCDPVAGLVQIPCIERNAIGAITGINACRLAMRGAGAHKVSLDQVIRTMYETGRDMQSRYKETSQAGLAVNAVDC